jgi:hypothetical protein
MKITLWPNNLGADVNSGRLTLEVWAHGGVRRTVKGDGPTGAIGTHYIRVATGSFEEMAAAAIEAWRNDRSLWASCE